MSRAYYSEIDPYAAEWLRNLIAVDLIAPGDVDTRSIEDVTPNDLRGYDQCHFFAGIGVWSYALRLAGWPDDRPVWTGSCPCQPFSAAGRGRGTADERHLWPAWFWLIEQCRPRVVFGEQVEAAIKHDWLDLVQTDLEGIGYATGAVGLPAAGVGAPHGRARLWFVADDDDEAGHVQQSAPRVHDKGQPGDNADGRGAAGELADREREGLEGHAGHGDERHEPRRVGANATGSTAEGGGAAGELGQPYSVQSEQPARVRSGPGNPQGGGSCGESTGSGTPGFWSDCEWLPCRDGKARPTQPGIQPLAHGVAARVGKLRAAGNAIVAPVAQEFIAAYMSLDRGA